MSAAGYQFPDLTIGVLLTNNTHLLSKIVPGGVERINGILLGKHFYLFIVNSLYLQGIQIRLVLDQQARIIYISYRFGSEKAFNRVSTRKSQTMKPYIDIYWLS